MNKVLMTKGLQITGLAFSFVGSVLLSIASSQSMNLRIDKAVEAMMAKK